MSLNVKTAQGGGTRPPLLDIGTYPARVVRVIDLGLQPQRPYKGKDKPPAYEVMLTYELLDEFMVDEDGNEIKDKPRWISETFGLYNLSSDKARSTKRYIALDPNMDFDGDFDKLVNVPCNVTIVHGEGKGQNAGKTYENVGSVSAMRAKDAAKASKLVNKSSTFLLDSPDLKVYNKFPDWLQNKIKGNLEYSGSKLEEILDDGSDKSESDTNDGGNEW